MSFWSNILSEIEYGLDRALSSFADFLGEIWDVIKEVAIWIIAPIVSLSRHIIRFFKNLQQRHKIKKNMRALNLKVGEILEEGDQVNVIDIGLKSSESEDVILSGLFNEDTGEFDLDNVQVIEFEELDQQLKDGFGGKTIMELK